MLTEDEYHLDSDGSVIEEREKERYVPKVFSEAGQSSPRESTTNMSDEIHAVCLVRAMSAVLQCATLCGEWASETGGRRERVAKAS